MKLIITLVIMGAICFLALGVLALTDNIDWDDDDYDEEDLHERF